jgi:hypothetical protein
VDIESSADHCGSSCTECEGPTPKCYSGSCVACLTGPDCPGLGSVCTANHTCLCRTPSSTNLLKNSGFDSSAALAIWSPSSGVSWNGDDSDLCPYSGSLKAVVTAEFDFGNFRQCVRAEANTTYYFGFDYGQSESNGVSCMLFFYSDENCSTSIVGGSLYLNGIDMPVDGFLNTNDTTTSPPGTQSAQVQCNTQAGDCWFDQFYLNTANQF